MFPLMHTVWIINRRLLFQFSPFLAFYLWALLSADSTGDATKTATVLIFFVSVVTIIVALQGLLLPVEEFILSLPVSRSQVVRVKYLSCLLGLTAGLALPLLTAWIAHLMAPSRIPALSHDVLGIGGLAALHLALGIFLFLPFVYQFGPTRGISLFALSLVAFLTGCLAWKGPEACTKALVDYGDRMLESSPFTLAIGAGVTAFGLASLAFSIWTYRNKPVRK
jgi:hypothetical protein